MNKLADLIKSLNRMEVSTLRHYYLKRTRKKTAKRLLLFNMLRNYECVKEEKVSFLLYKNNHDKRLDDLKWHLLNDVLNILLMKEVTPVYKTPYFQATVDCRKMLFQGDMLLKRGFLQLGLELLEKVSAKAEEYELPLLQLQADEILFNHKLARDGDTQLASYFGRINELLEKTRCIFKGQELLLNIETSNVFHSNIRNKFIKKIQESLLFLESLYKLNKSPNLGYYCFYMGMIGYRFCRNYEQAAQCADLLLDLLQKEKAVFSEIRFAMALLQKSTIFIHLGRYNEAIEFAQKGMVFFSQGSFNELRGMEILFEALYYAEQYDKAGKVIGSALQHSHYHYSKHSEKKWNFYKNNLLFMTKRYQEMNFERSNIDELMKDKSGFYPGCKILEIMSYIERKEYEMIDDKLCAMEKILIRQSDIPLSTVLKNGHNPDLKRIVAIFNLLKFLVEKNYNRKRLKSQYDFARTINERMQYYNLLKNNQGDFEWNPIGYEYVRFDDWLRKKAEEQVREEKMARA